MTFMEILVNRMEYMDDKWYDSIVLKRFPGVKMDIFTSRNRYCMIKRYIIYYKELLHGRVAAVLYHQVPHQGNPVLRSHDKKVWSSEDEVWSNDDVLRSHDEVIRSNS